MGFNKRIVGNAAIEEITIHPAIIELYLSSDALVFEDEEIEKKFQELKDEFLKTNTIG